MFGERTKEALLSSRAMFGWLPIVWAPVEEIWKPTEYVIDKLAEADFVREYWPEIHEALNWLAAEIQRPVGFLIALAAGFLWLAHVVRTAPQGPTVKEPSAGPSLAWSVLSRLGALALMVICADLLLVRIRLKQSVTAQPANPPAPLSRSVFISRITVDFGHLAKEDDLLFNIDAFNGSGRTISINKYADGSIYWGIGGPSRRYSFSSAPQVDPESRLNPQYPEEFNLTLRQHIPPDLAAQIYDAYSNGKSVGYLFDNLKIGVTSSSGENQREEERFPLWDGVVCGKQQSTCSHVVSGTASDSLTSSDSASVTVVKP